MKKPPKKPKLRRRQSANATLAQKYLEVLPSPQRVDDSLSLAETRDEPVRGMRFMLAYGAHEEPIL
jgi:hypothetical protein